MLKLRSVIVEDEIKASNALKDMIKRDFNNIEILATVDNIQDAYVIIQRNQPDIVFLDIKLGVDSGFDLLGKFDRITFQVVFTTAYKECALRAFDYPTPHFLVKPIDRHKLCKTINRIESAFTNEIIHERGEKYLVKSKFGKLAFVSSQSTELIDYQDILFLSADGSYTSLHLVDGSERMSSKILGHYEKVLNNECFCRIHRKYIVNIGHIVRYDRAKSLTIFLTSGDQLQSSLVYKAKLLKKIHDQTSF